MCAVAGQFLAKLAAQESKDDYLTVFRGSSRPPPRHHGPDDPETGMAGRASGNGHRPGLDPVPEMGDTTRNEPARPRDAARTSEDLRTWPR